MTTNAPMVQNRLVEHRHTGSLEAIVLARQVPELVVALALEAAAVASVAADYRKSTAGTRAIVRNTKRRRFAVFINALKVMRLEN